MALLHGPTLMVMTGDITHCADKRITFSTPSDVNHYLMYRTVFLAEAEDAVDELSDDRGPRQNDDEEDDCE